MTHYTPKNHILSTVTPTYVRGNYLIIDPCYFLGAEPFWSNFVSELYSDKFKGANPITMNAEGYDVFMFNTAYGDGVYPVFNNGMQIGEAGVDAGMLCVVSMEFIEKFCKESIDLGVVVNLEETSTPEGENGNLTLGNIFVDTAFEDDEEEEEDWWGDIEDEENEIDDFALEAEEVFAYNEERELNNF